MANAAEPEREIPIGSIFHQSLDDLLNLEITTASRTVQPVRRLPTTTYIITRKQIIDNHYQTLVDALRDLPGIKVSRPGSGILGEMFMMRGLLGNYHATVLLDGLPLTPSVTSGMPLGGQLDLRRVKQIEVLYGPAAAIYGADALAGVINITTLIPDEDQVHAATEVGELGFLQTSLFAAVSAFKGRNRLKLVAHGLWSSRDDLGIKEGNSDLFDRSPYEARAARWNKVPFALGQLPSRRYSFGLQALYRGFRLSYQHLYRRDNSSVGQRPDWYFYDDEAAIWGETIQRVALQHELKRGLFTFRSSLSYLRYRLDNQTYFAFIFPSRDPTTFGQRNRAYKYEASDDLLVEEVVSWDLRPELQLVAGLSYKLSGNLPKTNDLAEPFDEAQYSSFGTNPPRPDPVFGSFGHNPITYHNAAGFVQGLLTTRWVDAIAGLRVDYHTDYGASFNPRLAVQVNLRRNLSLRASYNRAFKAPSPFYRYNSVAGVRADGSIDYLGVPNPDLEPQRLHAGEIALRYVPWSNVSFELVGHVNRLTGRLTELEIDASALPGAAAGDRSNRFINDPEAARTVYGLDAMVRFHDMVSALQLNLDIFASAAFGNEILPGGDTIDNPLMIPHWNAKWRLSCRPLERLYLGLDSHYISSWYSREISTRAAYLDDWYKIEGYFLMDLVSSFEVAQGLRVYLKLLNLLDARHAGIQAYDSANLRFNPQPGRTFYAGVEYGFDLARTGR